MSFANLPLPLAAFLGAAQAQRPAALRSAFDRNARVETSERIYIGDEVEIWEKEALLWRPLGLKAVNVSWKGSFVTVTLLVTNKNKSTETGRLFDWTFLLAGEKITELSISERNKPAMPDVVSTFIDAVNTQNLAGALETLSDDVLINDQLREYRGHLAVAGWAESELLAYEFTMFVVSASNQGTNCSVTANVDGKYDKRGLPEPLVMTFYFSLNGNKIAQLIMLRNLDNM